MIDNTVIGKNIANYRKIKGLTQGELAKDVGVSKGYIAAIEKGGRRPLIKTLIRIAECLGVELRVLLED